MATAKNRALDRLRQEVLHARKREELGRDLDAQEAHLVPDFVDALDAARQDDIGDDLLRASGSLRDGTLYVRVLQPALHYQFEQISKAEILRKLKQRFGTKIIREIRFRVG